MTIINQHSRRLEMKEHSSSDRKKLAILGALGLGLMMASRKRRWQRYAFSQMHAAGGPGPGGFGGRGPWRRDWQMGGGQLPPMIDAKLRAWHEQEHAKAKSGGAPEGGQPQQV
jgi:hypothetical protein